MKQFFKMVPFLILVVGCNTQSAPKTSSKMDTFAIAYRDKRTGSWSMAMATGTPYKKFINEDSSSNKGKWIADTVSWKFYLVNPKDTIKDINKKPLYDSINHTYRYNYAWYALTPEQRESIQIVILPK